MNAADFGFDASLRAMAFRIMTLGLLEKAGIFQFSLAMEFGAAGQRETYMTRHRKISFRLHLPCQVCRQTDSRVDYYVDVFYYND